MSCRGSVLVEGIFAVTLFIFSTTFCIELARRGYTDLIVHYGSFEATRWKAFEGGPAKIPGCFKKFLEEAFGVEGRSKWVRNLDVFDRSTQRDSAVALHFRYAMFLRFSMNGQSKHHLEVTKRCRFPLFYP